MAQECGFFNAQLVGGEYDRVYLAEQFADYFASFIGNGVFGNSMEELQVIDNDNMTVTVLSGQAWINGWWYRNTSNYVLNHSIADGVLSRIDIIVLRWDNSERDIYLKVIEGTPSANPVAPSIVRNADYYDLQLCSVSIPAGSIKITQAQITDTRLNNSVCGLVTGVVDQIDTSSLFTQFQTAFQEWKTNQQADFEDWFDYMKDQLTEDAAGQLQSEIGILTDLTTQDKTNLVDAINEVNIFTTFLNDSYEVMAREQMCINSGANGIIQDLDELMDWVKAGRYDKFAIGDCIVDGNIHWRIHAKKFLPKYAFDTTGEAPNHIVLLPDEALGRHEYNTSSTNTGGYAASLMPSYLENTILPTLSQGLRSYIKETRIYENNKGEWGITKRKMRIPTVIECTGSNGWADQYSGGICSQLPLMRATSHRVKDYWYWCLDPVASNNTHFCIVHSDGSSAYLSAYIEGSIRPEIVLSKD